MQGEQVLLDSDAFIGWLTVHDAHHERMVRILEVMKAQRIQPLTTNLVVAETATMLSNRVNQAQAVQFLQLAASVQTVMINEDFHHQTLELFARQTRNKTSFVDLANVVVARTLDIPWILSFDKTYPRDFDLSLYPSSQEA
jgi:predicted nucleic acid-binding protein